MRNKIFTFFATILLFLICPVNTIYAGTVTVSTIGQLETAIKNSQPGDIIELADGVYQLNFPDGIVIKDKSDLTIRSQSGNRDMVILQGYGINSNTVSFVFKLYRSPRITLQDLTMKDVYWHHVQVNEGSSYFTLRNLVMLDAGEAPVKVTSPGGNGPFSDYGLIEDCWLGFTDRGVRDVVEGIDIIASVGTVIRNCEFYRVRAGKSPTNIGWGVFAKCNAQDTIIENNYFEDNDIAISFGNGGCPATYARNGDITYQHRGGIIRNNVVNKTKDVAVYINSATNFKVYNNTLWSTFKLGKSSLDVRFNSNGDIFNNIGRQNYRLRDGGTANLAKNIWNAGSSLFVDQPNGDFHLNSDASEAIDQGVDTSADVPYDMDWQVRPSGLAVDIGADEHACLDADNDSYDTCGADSDCNDDDPVINPGAAEVCDDSIDNDCDNLIDGDDQDCGGGLEICDNQLDDDGDGYVDCDDSDCSADPACESGGNAKERRCNDGVDNDGDGLIDCDDPDCQNRKSCK